MKFNISTIKKKLIKSGICLAALLVILTVSSLTNLSVSFEEFWENFSITVGQIFSLCIMALAVILSKEIIAMLLSVCQFKNHRMNTVVTILRSILQYIAWLVIICWGLAILGVDIGTIVASVGILALIVGFGAESMIADVVTGLFMLIENQYNVNDIVEVDGYRGTVIAIGIRTTSIQDSSGNIKVINNASMVNVLNRSENGSVAVTDFAVPYQTDLAQLEAQLGDILLEIYSNHTDVMEDAPQYAGVQSLTDSKIILRFTVNVMEKDIFHVARIMNHDLLLAFRARGIDFPKK